MSKSPEICTRFLIYTEDGESFGNFIRKAQGMKHHRIRIVYVTSTFYEQETNTKEDKFVQKIRSITRLMTVHNFVEI